MGAHIGGLAFIVAFVSVSPLEAQQTSRRCISAPEYAVGAPSLWPDQHERSPSDTATVAYVRLLERLRGSYDLVEVTSEGNTQRWVMRSVMELRGRPSFVSPLNPTRRVGGLFEAYLTGVDQGYLSGSPGPPGPDTRRRYLRGFYRQPDDLTLEMMDSTRSDSTISFNEGATIYTVTRIDSAGTLMGRWSSGGGFLKLSLNTWAGELLEPIGGYFCAWRRR